jgi:PIN domain nuclease of toxin-antitoxin system
MSNNKQSSVEWFSKESWKLRVALEDGKISLGEYANKYYQLKEKAKEMHKSEIVWAHGIKMKGVNNLKCVSGEQYYNETFGGNDEQ